MKSQQEIKEAIASIGWIIKDISQVDDYETWIKLITSMETLIWVLGLDSKLGRIIDGTKEACKMLFDFSDEEKLTLIIEKLVNGLNKSEVE